MTSRSKVSPEKRGLIVALRRDTGLAFRTIAHRVGVSESYARAVCIQNGLGPAERKPPGRLSESDRETMCNMYDDGIPAAEIAEKFGCATGTVLKYYREMRKQPPTDDKLGQFVRIREEDRKRRAHLLRGV